MDLSSDGTLFTHFLLLIYETLYAEQWREPMWQQHLTQLLRILITRIEIHGKERLPYVIWWLAQLDMYACLTAGGTGELVSTLTDNGLMPTPSSMTASLVGLEPAETIEAFCEVLELAQNVVMLAAKLGTLSHRMRNPINPDDLDLHQQSECYKIVYELKNLWLLEHPRAQELVAAAAITDSGSPLIPIINEAYEHARTPSLVPSFNTPLILIRQFSVLSGISSLQRNRHIWSHGRLALATCHRYSPASDRGPELDICHHHPSLHPGRRIHHTAPPYPNNNNNNHKSPCHHHHHSHPRGRPRTHPHVCRPPVHVIPALPSWT